MKLFPVFSFQILLIIIPYGSVQAQTKKEVQAQRRYEKVLEREKRDYDKRRKETLKHRFEIQTPEVQERMKETEKRSRLYGRKQTEPFFKKIFNRNKFRKKRRR